MSLFDHFSILAPYYERLIPVGSREKLLDKLALSPFYRVLDVGGGTGRIAEILQRYARNVIVADISFGMLRQVRFKEALQPLCTPSENLPFSERTFDRIVMVDAFHHVVDQAETAREMFRVLQPGGRIVIEEPDIRTTTVKSIAVFEKIFLMRSHFLPPQKIAELFSFSMNHKSIAIDSEKDIAWITITKD